MKNFLSFLSMMHGQEGARMKDISAKKQDKNEGKTASQT